ncbi:P60-like protein [Rhodofomes roseus]|uniref:Ribosome biogenesis protein NOP53 n=1 Tax=Rhodofomes roseus TaxID=34475 RepID=A0ABQ8K5S4_9APHY|nr:P60-like protein [Rhodofomes roseus]KAH9832149.1 P60-like protein [Rhodofomes roseus]
MAVKPTTKAMHNSPSNKGKKAASSIGAPAQHNQSSRKGKKAWRKNVDIGDVEVGMEELREEERVTGSILQKKTNEELFQVDVKGDEHVRRTQPKFSKALLTSTKILAQRSAVPAVITRTTANPLKRKNLTYEEKGRLLRMGKRPRKGPFNAVIDHTEMGAGSAMLEVSEAAKNSGTHDVWGDSSVQGTKVKHPKTPNPRSLIALPAVPTPHEGTSYNPLVTSHLELLRTAHEIEERRLKETEKLAEMKRKIDAARTAAVLEDAEGVARGMTVQLIDDADAELEADDGKELPPVKKMPERKTKQERRKASRLRAEKRALAERAARKRMLASVDSAKALRKAFGRNLAARERLRVQKQEKMQEKLRQGLAGQRLGKHKVPEGEVDVQLGEELTESLRALKPEGNLFRDRFLSMQHRALIEPRVPVLPRRRKMKIKEYEKHSYKRFDRDQ